MTNELNSIIDNISQAVVKFDSSYIWEFKSFVIQNLTLDSAKGLFPEIWEKASDIKYWDYPDLKTGVKNAIAFLSKEYSFQPEIANKIAWAIAYEWK